NRSVYCSPETLRSYKGHLKVFFDFLEASGGKSIAQLSFDDFNDAALFGNFIIYLRGKNVKNVTIRSYCRIAKAYLRYCYQNDLCPDYLKGVRMPPDDSVPKVVLYSDEVKKIDACFDMLTEKGRRNYCMFHLMLDCGLRSQEVRHLHYEDIDRERNIIHILESKGCKSRIALIPDFLIQEIDKYVKLRYHSSDMLFLSLRTNEPVTADALKHLFTKLKKESGIKRLHAHLLRHTFATSYLIGGGNLEFLRVFMGHSDYNVTKIYSQLAAESKMLGVDVYHLDPIFFKKGY
ncbi:MAG: site-specific integrase, partial [Lachnospiraceae bacterium]|nr:site-specific integrase [Lachnospiraceae bacterium]